MPAKKISPREKSACLGKVKHKTMLAAEASLDDMYKDASVKDWHNLEIYRCLFCKDLHIGHKLTTKNKSKKK